MKLLYCLECGDIFNLTKKEKACGCGKTKGKYLNNSDAEYSGNAQPIGIGNGSFRQAYSIQKFKDKQNKGEPKCCEGVEFNAFFIPANATTLTKVEPITQTTTPTPKQ